MCAFLGDLFRSYECTDQASCLVFDIPGRFLQWALSLNNSSSEATPKRAERPGRAAQPNPTQPRRGPTAAALGGTARAGRLRAAAASTQGSAHTQTSGGFCFPSHYLHTVPSAILPRRKLFSPITPKIQGLFQSGTHYQLALVFRLCTNCAVLMTTVIS